MSGRWAGLSLLSHRLIGRANDRYGGPPADQRPPPGLTEVQDTQSTDTQEEEQEEEEVTLTPSQHDLHHLHLQSAFQRQSLINH